MTALRTVIHEGTGTVVAAEVSPQKASAIVRKAGGYANSGLLVVRGGIPSAKAAVAKLSEMSDQWRAR